MTDFTKSLTPDRARFPLSCVSIILMIFAMLIPVMEGRDIVKPAQVYTVTVFNLVEFSPFGIIPFISSLIIILVLYGFRKEHFREPFFLVFFCVTITCYAHGLSAARAWLAERCSSINILYASCALHPLLLFLIIAIAILVPKCTVIDSKEV